MRMLDLFCGRFGWSKAFAARGWECVGVDLVEPAEIPAGCRFVNGDALTLRYSDQVGFYFHGGHTLGFFDFACASSPCEEFSVHGMKHFHPNPKFPDMGLALFCHTRRLLDAAGIPYVMENVRSAQQFVGTSVHHCGPFHLWGEAVPVLMPQGIQKGISMGSDKFRNIPPGEARRNLRKAFPFLQTSSGSAARKALTAKAAEIPAELANCVVDYAERILDLTPATGATCGTDEADGARKE